MGTDWASLAGNGVQAVLPQLRGAKLLGDLKRHGASVAVEGEAVRVSGRPLTPELRDRIKADKTVLLAFLRPRAPAPAEWDEVEASRMAQDAVTALEVAGWSTDPVRLAEQKRLANALDAAWDARDMAQLRELTTAFAEMVSKVPLRERVAAQAAKVSPPRKPPAPATSLVNAGALVRSLRSKGYTVRLDEGRLAITPSNRLTTDERMAIARERSGMIAALEEEQPGWEMEGLKLCRRCNQGWAPGFLDKFGKCPECSRP